MSDRLHVLHHANCPDGVTAYLIAKRFIEETYDTAVVRHPMDYGDDLPVGIDAGDEVVIVDFCPTVEQIQELYDGCSRLAIFDHHATALKIVTRWYVELNDPDSRSGQVGENGIEFYRPGKFYMLLDVDRSGAGITWDYFYFNEPRPDFVNYAEDKDLWRHKLSRSRQVGALINALPRGNDLTMYKEMMDAPALELIERSALPALIESEAVKQAAERGWWVLSPNGQKLPVTVCEYQFGSTAAERLTQLHDVPLGMYFVPGMPGDTIRCGVRGEGAQRFAETYGGGGHPNAAGFRLDSWEGWAHHER